MLLTSPTKKRTKKKKKNRTTEKVRGSKLSQNPMKMAHFCIHSPRHIYAIFPLFLYIRTGSLDISVWHLKLSCKCRPFRVACNNSPRSHCVCYYDFFFSPLQRCIRAHHGCRYPARERRPGLFICPRDSHFHGGCRDGKPDLQRR